MLSRGRIEAEDDRIEENDSSIFRNEFVFCEYCYSSCTSGASRMTGLLTFQVNGSAFPKSSAALNGVTLNGSGEVSKLRSSSVPSDGRQNGVVAPKYEKCYKPEKPERKLNSKELIEKQRNWTSHFSKPKPTARR